MDPPWITPPPTTLTHTRAHTHTHSTQRSPPSERKEIFLPYSLVKHDHGREEQAPIHVSAQMH